MHNIELFRQLVTAQGEQVTTTSRKIAELFGKRHGDVLRAIDRAIERRPDLSKFCIESIDGSGPNGRSIRFFVVSGEMTYLLFAKFSLGAKAGSVEIDYLDRLQDIFPHRQVRQMSVCDGKYRVDCYIPSLSVVVEVYEKEHRHQLHRDEKRRAEIEEWIANKKADHEGVCFDVASSWTGFVVIKEGGFGAGVRDIISFVTEELMSIDPILIESYWDDHCHEDMEWYGK